MKTFHYCASYAFEKLDVHPNEDAQKHSITSQLTEQMVLKVIADNASGAPPYRLVVPREILHEVALWSIPESLLKLEVVVGNSGTTEPFDEAVIQFRDTIVHLHCRRVVDVFHQFINRDLIANQ